MSKKEKGKDTSPKKPKQAKIVKLDSDRSKNPLTSLFQDLQKLNEEIESHLKNDEEESDEEKPIGIGQKIIYLLGSKVSFG